MLSTKMQYSCTNTHVLNLLCMFIHFSPAGWDNLKKIKIVQESLITIQPDDNFSEHIRKPHIALHKPKKDAPTPASGPELTCDDNQKFLQRMHKLMLSGEQHTNAASTATGERTQQVRFCIPLSCCTNDILSPTLLLPMINRFSQVLNTMPLTWATHRVLSRRYQRVRRWRVAHSRLAPNRTVSRIVRQAPTRYTILVCLLSCPVAVS